MKKTQAPKIKISKEIISKGDEHIHCVLCQYGRKEGVILWRIEFSGEIFSFHWILCNRCRFLLFKATGGKRLKNLEDMVEKKQISSHLYDLFLSEPKQKISSKGVIKSSYYYSMSADRREALDNRISVREYENKMFRKMDKKRKKKK